MEKKILIAVIIVMVLTMMTGCHKEFSRLNKRFSTTQKTYIQTDSLFIKNYILWSTQDHQSFTFNNKPIPISEDSVMKVVWKSFEKLDLPIVSHFEKGQNHIDSTFYKDYLIRIRKIDQDFLKKIAGNYQKTRILIPVINLRNSIIFTGYITSGGMSGSNGFNMVSFVNLIVFIIEDKEIIYSRQIRHSSEITKADSRVEAEAIPPAPLVTQEVWDELVRLAMEDYTKRLK
jgi:hypothetical protein